MLERYLFTKVMVASDARELGGKKGDKGLRRSAGARSREWGK